MAGKAGKELGTRGQQARGREGSGVEERGTGAKGTGGTQGSASMAGARQGPTEQGTLSSGYSSQSSANGTPGDVMRQEGLDMPGGRRGAAENESDPLAREGVTAGAAGEDAERAKVESRERATGRVPAHDEDTSMDGGATVLGVAGVSGGGSGTTRIDNTRR